MEPADAFKKFPSRARAAFWSKGVLLVAAIVSGLWVCLPFGFDLEGVLIAIALAAITFFEYRVHRYFSSCNPEAPLLGFRNQSFLAVVILIYGLYHAFWPDQVPPEFQNMIDAPTLAEIRSIIQGGYIAIGVAGGLSQFGLAWYYRTARSPA